jgi:hypothetical protein
LDSERKVTSLFTTGSGRRSPILSGPSLSPARGPENHCMTIIVLPRASDGERPAAPPAESGDSEVAHCSLLDSAYIWRAAGASERRRAGPGLGKPKPELLL